MSRHSSNQQRDSGRGMLATGVVLGLAVVGVLLFFKEVPAMRRYARMERM